jgi:hypothetical protein
VTTALDPPGGAPAQATAAQPEDARRWRRRRATGERWWHRARRSAFDPEWRRVALLATAASLSAFSFWQATRFAEEDAEVRERARLATIDAAQDERELQALVDFDLDLYTGYCSASVERDGALETMFESGLSDVAPARQALVTQRLRADSLWGLLQADVPGTACATGDPATGDPATDPYSIERAREWRTAQDPTFGAAGLPPASAVGGAARAERQLMYAAVVFAAALFLLTAAGLAERDPVTAGGRDGRRKAWVRVWQVLAGAALATGSVLIVIHVHPRTVALWLAATGAALAIAYGLALRVPRHRRPHAEAKGVRWWAELVGGIALVALALAALELSAVAGRERSARALADRQSVAAERLLEAGEQAALHDLATSAELAELDARAAAANQDAVAQAVASNEGAGTTTEVDRIEHARVVTGAHAEAVADRSGEALDGDAGLVPDETCPEEPRPVRPSYDRLLAAAWTDPQTFGAHIAASREEGEVCSVLAGLSRAEADVWAARAKVLTVSLVALGLGGFLLALAADPKRTPAPARWLLSLGVVGVGAGAAVALSVLVHGLVDHVGLDRSTRVDFAEDVAAAQTSLARGSCESALRELDQALAIHDGYAPAYGARAEARLCSKDDTWLFSPPLRDGRVEAALEDEDRAAELREPGATELADIAWLRFLVALDDPRLGETALYEATALADEAARAASDVASPGVHVARFNHALARLAIGEDAEPEYRYALRCLDPAASCPGGGIEDDSLVAVYRLMALDDLELLASRVPETKLDRYRALVMSDDAVAVAPAEGPRSTLAVFPQELELDTPDEPDTEVAIVWYHRADPERPWDVIDDASLSTAVPGDHDNTPIPTYHPLPAGEYRADVYSTDGRLSRTVTSWGGAPGDQRVVVPDLGISAVVPPGWSVTSREHGVETAIGYGAAPDVLVFRRTEGKRPDADRELDDWLNDTLDEWIATRTGPDVIESALDVTDDHWWYLGLWDIRVREYPDANVRAFIGVAPYAIDPYCGGTVFMTLVRDPDSAVVATVVDSLVLDQAATSTLDPFTDLVDGDEWSVELPEYWVGAYLTPVGAEDRFAAQDCISGAWMSIETEEVPEDEIAGSDPLPHIADTRVTGLIDSIDGLTREGWDETELASGDPAVDVTLATTIDGFAIEHRVLYVLDGTTLTTLSFTVPGDGDYDDVVDRAFDSFALA